MNNSRPLRLVPSWLSCHLFVGGLIAASAGLCGCAGLPYGAQKGIYPGATVDAYRLEPTAERGSPADAQTFDGYKVIAGPVRVKPEVAERLTGALTDRYTYQSTFIKPDCPFRPLIGFRYPADPYPVDLIVSFDCNLARFVRRTADGRPTDRDEDIRNARQVLIDTAKETFPEDSTLGGLDPGKPWKAGK